MRTYNYLYEDGDVLCSFLHGISLQESDSVLVRIHSAIHSKEEVKELIGRIKDIIPSARVIGCSAMQIINEGRLIPDACLISVSVFEKSDIVIGRLPCRDSGGVWKSGLGLGNELLKKLATPDGFMLIFFPLAYSKIEGFVDSINKSGFSMKMLGGAAYLEDEAGNSREDLAYVIADDDISTEDAVFAYITAPELHIYGDYVCGVEAVGRRSKIKSNGCYIEEVDNMSGAEWYSSMLGPEAIRRDPSLSHVFPLVKRDERGIAYYVDYIPCDKGDREKTIYKLKSFGELENGSRVSLGYFNPQNIFNQVKDMIKNVRKRPAESVFAYDCQSRMSLLHNCASWEIANFNTTNISGALLSGEISSRNGENLYANYTFVIAVLSEHEDSHFILDIPDVTSVHDLQEDNVQLLNYLLVNANKHLSDELQQQQERIQDAVFYNAAVGVDNQLKYLFDKDRDGLNKTAIFVLNNEKMLRLFSGVTETYLFIKDCYENVRSRFSTEGLYFYCYNDTSLFIAANDVISDEQFVRLVDEIHDFVNNSVYDDIKLSYTTVVLLGSEDSMHNLETAIHYAKSHKLSKVRFDEINEDLKSEQEDIHVLWVIREALLHRRVVPFFQEIHNNKGGDKRMYESLMRIMDEDGKIYFPDKFLPISKEFDLYENLSELMVKTVIEMFMNKDACVTINLNVQDIYNRNMLRMIFKYMQEAPHPENFVFEIVESEEIGDYEYIKGFADCIHEYGAKIAIDDFGSGFSNIMHVLKIGADYIKIDGAIIRTIISEPRCRDFIEFMNSWCKKMGQKLICEYIENEEIQRVMEEIGVPFSQGYYFSKPHRWGPEDEY